jgi:hypothetical protein
MKAMTKLVISCVAICALAIGATARTKWKLSSNLLATNNQISFNQGAGGVWYFLRSTSLAHEPKTYQFLPAYYEPCVSDQVSFFADGMACWQNPELERGIYRIPLVGVNFTDTTQLPNGLFGIPARSVFVHPSTFNLGIIGWKSPFSGSVDVAGYFSHLDQSCGNGIIWSVEKGTQTLASGAISFDGPPQTFNIANVSVKVGQVLYFVVDPNGENDFCDTSGIDVTITKSHRESERE